MNRTCQAWVIVSTTSPPTSSVQWSRWRYAAASSRVRIAALAVDADGALERGDPRPVERVGMDGDAVALGEDPHPVVEPPDHDRADRRDGRGVAAGRGELVQPALDRLGDRDRLRDREADRGIDADPGRRRRLDRGDPGPRRGELDLDVRRQAREAEPLLEHPLGVRVVRRVRLDRQPALAPALAHEHRFEHGGAADGHLLDHGPGDVGLGP